ncbi:hybrid-cluster NAD(P)-dependent oxidoreductase [Vibrio panuliri]|uniref:Hybrid-cluster NAD(P)-dependent oxidoreductase n=1 Tax=Vibrio panuliri TaxID=1381081 RepID=A0A1Q9HJD2_9VIBR|nr:hybrid-cluster NAD(P)-dependent oxidoreductase [Vibrio panuliri]OLQ90390.1 hybrid-cluster NAD(P)-dependent oxidoreductase [Vibrio panuliri]
MSTSINAAHQQQSLPATLRCIDKWFETKDCVSILLSAENPSPFKFKPGQFVTIGVEVEGKAEYRAYSISSLPNEQSLQLTIKRVDGGKVSNYMVDHLTIGDSVECLPVAGEFNNIDYPPQSIDGQKKVLLISAGCGITPVFSMARSWLAQSDSVDICFLHIARNIEQTIYFEQLEKMHQQEQMFDLKLLLKDAQSSGYPQGRLTAELLESLVPDFATRTVYLCGPSQFMLDVVSYLERLDFDMANFHQESFTPTESGTIKDTSASSDSVSIELPAFGQNLQVSKGTVLADALEQGGVPIIIACRSGICGSCKCKVKVGQVESSSHSPLSEEEIAQGYVLACSSTIESNVTIEL